MAENLDQNPQAEERKLEPSPVLPEHYPTEWGASYLVEEKSKLASIDMFKMALAKGGYGLFISATFPKQLRTQYGFKEIRFMWVSDTAGGAKSFNPRRLEFEISANVSKSIKATKNCVVFLDNLELLLLVNPFEKVVSFLKFVIDLVAVNEGMFIVPIDPSVTGAKELAILEKTMNVVLVPEKEIKERQNAELELKRAEELRRKLEYEVKSREEERKIAELKLRKIEEERLKVEAEHRAIAAEQARAGLELKRLEEERAAQETRMRIVEEERKRAELNMKIQEEERKKLEMELRMMEEQKRKLELEQTRIKELKRIEKMHRKVSYAPWGYGQQPSYMPQYPVQYQMPQLEVPQQTPRTEERKVLATCENCSAQLNDLTSAIKCGCGRYYHDFCIAKAPNYQCKCGTMLEAQIRFCIEKYRSELKSAYDRWAAVGVHSEELMRLENELRTMLSLNVANAMDFARHAVAQISRINTDLSPNFSVEFIIRTPLVPGQWCDEEFVLTNTGRSTAHNIMVAMSSQEADIVGIEYLPELREAQSNRTTVKIRPRIYGDISVIVKLVASRLIDNKVRNFTITKRIQVQPHVPESTMKEILPILSDDTITRKIIAAKNACQKCKKPLFYITQYERWYCPECRLWFRSEDIL